VPSPFVTVRYPDGAWELALSEKVPKVGDMLKRSGGNWIVAKATEDTSGHIIVTCAVRAAIGVTNRRASRLRS